MKPRALKILLVAGLAALLAGCASGPHVQPGPGLTVVNEGALPTPSANDMSPEPRGYAIGPLDKLSLVVFGIEDLSLKEVQVDTGGNIGVPLLGTVRAAGLSPNELAANISAGLRTKGVLNPKVTVGVEDIVSQLVAVEGEVHDPGLFAMEGRMTLLRAVAKAKGLTDNARSNDVLVFRTVNHQRLVGVYDLRALRAGTYEDPEVFANDLVVVGDSPARRTFTTLVQGAALLSPLVYLLK